MLKAGNCAVHAEIPKSGWGEQELPHSHGRNWVTCQTFPNTRGKKRSSRQLLEKKNKKKNLWGLNEKLPPNESITRKQMENKRGTSKKSNDMFKRAKHQYSPEN